MTSVPTPPDAASPVTPRRRRGAVLTGLVVAVLVLVGGGLFWSERPAEYRATTTLVVLPKSDSAELASYYDTLSSGQIASTLAQILDLRGSAATASGQVPKVTVEVLPSTSLIQVTATASTAKAAEATADATLDRVRPYFGVLRWPYDVSVVRTAAGTAEPTGLSPALLAAVVAVLSVVAAVAAYLAVRGIQQARQQSRRAAERASAEHAGDVRALAPAPVHHEQGVAAAHDGSGTTGSRIAGRMSRPTTDPLPSQPVR